MNQRPFWFAARGAALVATWALAQTALAAAYTYQTVSAAGGYFTDAGVQTNSNPGLNFPTGNGSSYWFVTCVGSDPQQPGCTTIPGFPEPNAWYKQPSLPTSAASQAWTPDYGVLKARAWSSGTSGVNSGAPGYTVYTAAANSGWVDEITTTSAVPVVITFVMSLHANWNDGGAFGLMMGRPGAYDPDVGSPTPMDGRTWTNCAVCIFEYDTGAGARTLLPGGDNGSADLIVMLPFTVYPASFADPEDPNAFTNHFEAVLHAAAWKNDAEVDAFSTATLQTILVPPNAGLSFASGHGYSITVVPEPSTYALWLLGLVGIAAARHQRSRIGGTS
jgi:hypothetical protein